MALLIRNLEAGDRLTFTVEGKIVSVELVKKTNARQSRLRVTAPQEVRIRHVDSRGRDIVRQDTPEPLSP